MKIAYLGTFDVENYGDLLLPLILEKRLAGLNAEITHFSPIGGAPLWKDCVPTLAISELFKIGKDFDAVIVGGGNTIQAANAASQSVYGRRTLRTIFAYPSLWLAAAHAAAENGLPLCWNAPGVPFTMPPDHQALLRWAVSPVDYLSVRDRESKERLREAGVQSLIDVVPDTSLEVSNLWTREELEETRARFSRRLGRALPARTIIVHVNAAEVREDDREVARSIDTISRLWNACPVLVPLCRSGSDARRVAACMSSQSIVMSAPESVREIAALFAHAEGYFGSSLHGMITACSFGIKGLLIRPKTDPTQTEWFGLEPWTVPNWAAATEAADELLGVSMEPWTRVRSSSAPILDEHWKHIIKVIGSGRSNQRSHLKELPSPDRAAEWRAYLPLLSEALAADDPGAPAPLLSPEYGRARRHLHWLMDSRDAQFAALADAARWHEHTARKFIDLLDQLHATTQRLYRSKRWRLGSPILSLLSRVFPSRYRAPVYEPLEEISRASELARAEKQPTPIETIIKSYQELPSPPPVAVPTTPPVKQEQATLTPYEAHRQNNRITPVWRDVLTEAAATFTYRPTISILMPVFNAPIPWLKTAIESVRAQIYPEWELCIADDASTDPALLEYLHSLPGDPRIRLTFRAEAGYLGTASNSAATLASGEFVALLDQDAVLEPHALFEMVRVLQEHRDADLLYSDEDKIDENERCDAPLFKPDWSPELLLSYHYVGNFLCVRRSLFNEVGGVRAGYEGAHDHDLLLRLSARTNRVQHIAKVLYHERAPSAAPRNPYPGGVARAAIADYLREQSVPATTYVPELAKRNSEEIAVLDWPDEGPRAVILIPTYNQHGLLRRCVESVLQKTTYKNYRVLIIDNGSNDPESLAYLRTLTDSRMRVTSISNDGGRFSYSRINNLSVGQTDEDTELLVFLNDDTEVIEPRWLSRLAGYLSLPGVGATGARLLYPDGKIQHAGVVLNMANGTSPGHAFASERGDKPTYAWRGDVPHTCMAVTAACFVTRRDLFLELGGFNEEHYPVSLNDVDFCLRLRERGLRSLYVANAELLHHECSTRGRRDDPAELAEFRKRTRGLIDPYYNPSLSKSDSHRIDTGCHLDHGDYLRRPLRLSITTPDLRGDAGPARSVAELALAFKQRGRFRPSVISREAGPLETFYRGVDIPVRIHLRRGDGWTTLREYESEVAQARRALEQEQPDVLIVNSLRDFLMVDAASRGGIPCIWAIHECAGEQVFANVVSAQLRPRLDHAFAAAARVIFPSRESRDHFGSFHHRNNFEAIARAFDPSSANDYLAKVGKAEARRLIDIPMPSKLIVSAASQASHDGLTTLMNSIVKLERTGHDFHVCLLTKDGDLRDAEDLIRQHHLGARVTIVPTSCDPFPYFRAADVFLVASTDEAFPRAVLEAEIFGLPIVATACHGIQEQVREEVNAFIVPVTDATALASRLAVLLDDDRLRERMGRNSRQVFGTLLDMGEIVARHEQALFGAYGRCPWRAAS